MITLLSLAARKWELTGLFAGMNGGAVQFFTGPAPTFPDDAAGGMLLGSVPLDAQAGTISDAGGLATLTLAMSAVLPAALSGTVGFVRFVNSSGAAFFDLPVGLAGSGKPVIVNVINVYAGGDLQLVSCVISK